MFGCVLIVGVRVTEHAAARVRLSAEGAACLYRAGKYLPDNKAALAWSTPPTMRNVDAECIVKIDDIYLRRAEGHND